MPTGITSSIAFRNASFDGGRIQFLDAGAGHAYFELFADEERPASGAVPPTARLVKIELSKPCASVANGVATLLSDDAPMVTVTGTPRWARFYNGNGQFAFDCDASVLGGAGQVQVPTVPIFAGGRTSLAAGALTQL